MKYRYTDEKRQHLHELDKEDGAGYRPLIGTTTALNEVFPPPLAWYGSAKALERLGWITEKKEPDAKKREELLTKGQEELRLAADMNLEEYRAFLEECYKNHDTYKKERGKAGTDMHAEIEKYIKECLKTNEGVPLEVSNPILKMSNAVPFIKWAVDNVDRFLWSEAHCYSEKLWLGGITDFGFFHKKEGKVIIGDAKPGVYPKSFIQTALYGLQIKENGVVDSEGKLMGLSPSDGGFNPVIDGYCIFDYNKGVAHYRTDVERLESFGTLAVDLYKHKDIIGTPTLS